MKKHMNKFRNLVIYSVSLVALFSLTAISCDDFAAETPDITTQYLIEETFQLTTTEATEESIPITVDPNDSQTQEYRDKIKSYDPKSVSIYVTDNDKDNVETKDNFARAQLILVFSDGSDYSLEETENLNDWIGDKEGDVGGYEIDLTATEFTTVKDYLEGELDAGSSFELRVVASANGAVDYTIDVVIDVDIKVPADAVAGN